MDLKDRRVLLTGAEHVQGLVAARSLGRAGAVVHLAATIPTANARSRYVTAGHRHPHPLEDAAGFIEWVAALARREGLNAVLPIDDKSTFALTSERARAELPDNFVVVAPRGDLVRLSLDKQALADAATAAGVATPAGTIVRDPGEVAAIFAAEGAVVVKSRWAIGERDDGLTEGGRVWRCGTEAAAVAAARDVVGAEGEALVQQVVPGVEYGVGVVRGRAGELPYLVQRRVRSWPPTGGPPSLVRATPAPPRLIEAVARLLDSLEWVGAAQADVMVDGEDVVVLDLNARLWFSVGLGPRAGVDFPVLAVAAGFGEQLPTLCRYDERAGWGYVDSELRHFACLVANRRGVRNNAEGPVQALRRLAAEVRRPIIFDPFDRRDPWPAVGRLVLELPRTLMKNRRESSGRRRQPDGHIPT